MVRKAHFGGKYNLSKSKMFWLWQAGPDERHSSRSNPFYDWCAAERRAVINAKDCTVRARRILNAG